MAIKRSELPYTESIRQKIIKAIKDMKLPDNANGEFMAGISEALKIVERIEL